MNSSIKGARGELVAAEYLQAKGYQLIAKNFRNRKGEIDLVARHEDSIVFVEVKTWNYNGAADLEYSINEKKRQRIIQASRFFMGTHPELASCRIRFDVILIANQLHEINHLENAFGG